VPSQAELFPREEMKLVPEPGRTAPRFWIRRMVIWSEPGQILREITFRPGLNIVWSPDPGETEMDAAVGVIGHGSGKTTFCRLLRYCLGEETFGFFAVWSGEKQCQAGRLRSSFPASR